MFIFSYERQKRKLSLQLLRRDPVPVLHAFYHTASRVHGSGRWTPQGLVERYTRKIALYLPAQSLQRSTNLQGRF